MIKAVPFVDVLPPLSRAVVHLLVRFERLLPGVGGLPRHQRRGSVGLHLYLDDGSQPIACLGLHVNGGARVHLVRSCV